jgi:hypothetical protein
MDELNPKDRAEAIALYRAQIVGPVVRRELERGDLRAALLELTKQRFRPPRALSPSAIRSRRSIAGITHFAMGVSRRCDPNRARSRDAPAS